MCIIAAHGSLKRSNYVIALQTEILSQGTTKAGVKPHRTQTIAVLLLVALLIGSMALPGAADGLTSYIDEHNRLILNGEPFFPIGLYVVHCSNGSYSAQLNEIADSSFDTVMNYAVNQCGTDATDAQILAYLDELESRNLNLVFSLAQYFGSGQDDIDTITHKVTTFKNHPAVISWYLNDERDPATYLTQLEERYQKIKELDENHPVWSVHWNTGWLLPEAHTTDILGMDSYPIAHLLITEVSRVADGAAQAGAQTGKPFWLVPQIFSWTDYPGDFRAATGRPPTKDEMRAMTYLAVNHGAKGLIYYSYFNIRDDTDYNTRWPQIKDIAGEIQQLRHVFLSVEQTNENNVICDHADIDFKLMRHNNTYYLFAVNTANSSTAAVSFQINVTNQPKAIETLFEDGRIEAVTDGNFADDFGPNEVHVYSWPAIPIINSIRGTKEPDKIVRILGSGFGTTQGDSTVHFARRTYDSTRVREVLYWSDTKIRVRIPAYRCDWFKGKDFRRVKVWVTVEGTTSNERRLKVMKPDTCP